jgi:hypothetical protein
VEESSYTCPSCGEEIVVPVDLAGGALQEYVEDCPVCCCPILLTLRVEPDGHASLSASPE